MEGLRFLIVEAEAWRVVAPLLVDDGGGYFNIVGEKLTDRVPVGDGIRVPEEEMSAVGFEESLDA
jgi:hypothetical protein